MGSLITLWRTHPARGRRAVSQRRLAAELKMSQGQLSRIESGYTKIVNLDTLRWWAEALGLPPALSWFGPYTHPTPDRRLLAALTDGEQALPRRGEDRYPASAERLLLTGGEGLHEPTGTHSAQRLLSLARHARAIGHQFGSRVVVRSAQDIWHLGRERLEAGDHGTQEHIRLQKAVAEAAVDTGWLLLDAGAPEEARRYMATGERMAHDIDALDIHVYALSHLAISAGLLDRFRMALTASLEGQELGVKLASNRLLSMLSMSEAIYQAGLGDRRSAVAAMERGFTRYSRGPGDNDPKWAKVFDIHTLASRVFYEMGEFAKAHEELELGLPDPANGHYRDRVALTMRVALSHLRMDEVDKACALTETILDELADHIWSSWLTERVAMTLRQHLELVNCRVVRQTLEHWDETLR